VYALIIECHAEKLKCDEAVGEGTMHRWVNEEKRRYYQVHLVEDMFGDWSLIACWGSLDSRRGEGCGRLPSPPTRRDWSG